jgi:hypothetical protein
LLAPPTDTAALSLPRKKNALSVIDLLDGNRHFSLLRTEPFFVSAYCSDLM